MRNRIYGPVPSRRLGLSLGIDLAEMKHCPLDCIYCQLKETTRHDALREAPATIADIVDQVRDRLASGAMPDFLTLGGSGEPTLYSGLGDLIAELRRNFGLPIALLTNAVLFGDPAVRRDAAMADVVLPSLDAWDEESFKKINRPCPGIGFREYIDGLAAFRGEFKGEIWLEVMILRNMSDTPETIAMLAAIASRLRPDRIQLNTPVRPPATSMAAPVSHKKLVELEGLFSPKAEATADFPDRPAGTKDAAATAVEVMEMLERRPCTVDDLASGLGVHRLEVIRITADLLNNGRVMTVKNDGQTYFKPAG